MKHRVKANVIIKTFGPLCNDLCDYKDGTKCFCDLFRQALDIKFTSRRLVRCKACMETTGGIANE